jgi:methylated-DNA-[protein]-cysteine S-methyltransferase
MMTDTDGSLERALAGFAPPVRRPEPADADVWYAVEDTAVGRLLLTARSDGTLLTSAYAPDDADVDRLLDLVAGRVSPRVLRSGRALDTPRRELEEFLAGRRRAFDLAVDLTLATPFQRTVLDTLPSAVGYGQTISYGSLAHRIGRDRAARAVGTALGANPLCVVLPCHRVIASSGALTGYAGGLQAKQFLLELEARSLG